MPITVTSQQRSAFKRDEAEDDDTTFEKITDCSNVSSTELGMKPFTLLSRLEGFANNHKVASRFHQILVFNRFWLDPVLSGFSFWLDPVFTGSSFEWIQFLTWSSFEWIQSTAPLAPVPDDRALQPGLESWHLENPPSTYCSSFLIFWKRCWPWCRPQEHRLCHSRSQSWRSPSVNLTKLKTVNSNSDADGKVGEIPGTIVPRSHKPRVHLRRPETQDSRLAPFEKKLTSQASWPSAPAQSAVSGRLQRFGHFFVEWLQGD